MLPYAKQTIVITDTAPTAGETITGYVDTLGFDFCTIDVVMGTADSVSNNPSVFKLQESDDLTTYADITAFVGDGTGGWTIPTSKTAVNNTTKFNVDLHGRKRYLKLLISPLTTQATTAIANLFRGEDLPINTTIANVQALVNG